MHRKLSVAFAVLCFCVSLGSSAAAITYQGTLTPGVAVTGSVSGTGWDIESAADVDFWRFSALAGDLATIRGTRLNVNLDPAFSLYSGTTTADESLFRNVASFGGLTFIDFADDEVEVPGPFGDPLLANFRLPSTGSYTIAIGGSFSAGAGPFGYSLLLTAQAVPEPTPMALLGVALVAVMVRKRGRH